MNPDFEANSKVLAADLGGVRRSPELQNYEPSRPLDARSPLPEDIRELLGWPKPDGHALGAYHVAR
jgi:hypothetical protein